VAIISSGDEIVPIEAVPKPGEIRDINRYTIVSMVEAMRPFPLSGYRKGPLRRLEGEDRTGIEGSGHGDYHGELCWDAGLDREVLQSLPGTEILGHGVSIRPGKPTLLADISGKPFLGLPGHPVSAMVIFHFFGKPILKMLSGISRERVWHQMKVTAKATRNIPSVPGREDYVRVRLEEKNGTFWAQSHFWKVRSHLAFGPGEWPDQDWYR
jgi:molybdopterin molybdotransferase